MNKIISIFLLLLLIIVFIFISNKTRHHLTYLTIDNKKFTVDIAKTKTEQAKGLAVYNTLPKDKGMLFPFDSPDYYAFWMKDMKFSIDIIYINKNKIVDIFSNVPSPKTSNEALPVYRPKNLSDMVLEINAGLSKKYNFKTGDLVMVNY